MNAILLLSAVMAGQVGKPANAPPIARNRPVSRQAAPRLYIYKIRHEGLTFNVRGYHSPALKRIVWNEDDPFNQQTYSMALVSQATFGDEQEETPALVIRPLVASHPASSGMNERMPARLTRRSK